MSNEASKIRVRSPSYPSMALGGAIEAVGKIETLYRGSAVGREAAAKLIGYSSLSGPANKALAALAAYGLLERAGKGDARVTSRARTILHGGDAERKVALMEAAFEPPLFRAIRAKFEDIPVPPEDGVVNHLNREGFNKNAVRPAARAFLETMRFIQQYGDSESHGAEELGERSSNDEGESQGGSGQGSVKPGDRVQWASDGIDQFATPAQVLGISECAKWVFTDQGEAGIPMDELRAVDPGGAEKAPAIPPHILALRERSAADQKAAGTVDVWREETDLDEGQATITLPDEMSAESVEDLEYWLKGVLRKAKRRAGVTAKQAPPTGEEPKNE